MGGQINVHSTQTLYFHLDGKASEGARSSTGNSPQSDVDVFSVEGCVLVLADLSYLQVIFRLVVLSI